MPATTHVQLRISSPAFEDGNPIPPQYTCDGESINPPLQIGDLPDGTQSLAIIAEDPDAPNGTFFHWVCFNISPTHKIAENHQPGISGHNSHGKTGYTGPCPPGGEHQYFFTVYALDSRLDLMAGAEAVELKQKMQPHLLGSGRLMGRYSRQGKAANN